MQREICGAGPNAGRYYCCAPCARCRDLSFVMAAIEPRAATVLGWDEGGEILGRFLGFVWWVLFLRREGVESVFGVGFLEGF